MFALLAAAVFLIDLIFKPHGFNLLLLGLFLVALHLAVGDVVGLWRRRP